MAIAPWRSSDLGINRVRNWTAAKATCEWHSGSRNTAGRVTLIGPGDPGVQADQACRNIDHWMKEAGGGLKDVCKLTVYVTEIEYRSAVYEAINRWFEGVQHCSTGVVVQGLADPSLLVEIDAMAVIDT